MRAMLRAVSVWASAVVLLPLSVVVAVAGLVVVTGAALGGGSGVTGETPTATAQTPTEVAVAPVALTVRWGGDVVGVPATGWGGDDSGGGAGNGGCSGPTCGAPRSAWSAGGGMPGQQAGGSAGMDPAQGVRQPSGGGLLDWLSKLLGLTTGGSGGDRDYRGVGPGDDDHRWAGKPGDEHWPGTGRGPGAGRDERGERGPGQAGPGPRNPGMPGSGPDKSGKGDDPGRDTTMRGPRPGPDTGSGGQPPLNGSDRGLAAWLGGLMSKILRAVAVVIDEAVAELRGGGPWGSPEIPRATPVPLPAPRGPALDSGSAGGQAPSRTQTGIPRLAAEQTPPS